MPRATSSEGIVDAPFGIFAWTCRCALWSGAPNMGLSRLSDARGRSDDCMLLNGSNLNH
ncbi:hypothetical protein HaLaN_31619, partial [Haematococcus lacustris]